MKGRDIMERDELKRLVIVLNELRVTKRTIREKISKKDETYYSIEEMELHYEALDDEYEEIIDYLLEKMK
jgi:hypothetical protein